MATRGGGQTVDDRRWAGAGAGVGGRFVYNIELFTLFSVCIRDTCRPRRACDGRTIHDRQRGMDENEHRLSRKQCCL